MYKKYFEEINEEISIAEAEEKYPMFYMNENIFIKFPTYKIRIIDKEIEFKDVQELLKEIKCISIYEECNVVDRNDIFFKQIYPITVHCLKTKLIDNIALAEQIEQILEEHRLISERCITFACYPMRVTINEKGNIVVVDK